MKIRLTILVLVLIPVLVAGGFAVTHKPMTAPVVAVLGAVMIWLAYTRYARRIDAEVIRPDDKKATPARMYMDGVDFMPTSRNVLYGYHFKSIAAAGPIVGPIAAATLWGWMPALLWLTIGVAFIGWASDYSAIVVAVRNDGNSLSAIAHRLIAPRARIILFVFIFFYLLLLAGAFVGIMAGIFDPRADVPFGIFMLAIMGLLLGQMLYRWKMDLILVTVVAVGLTLAGAGSALRYRDEIVQAPGFSVNVVDTTGAGDVFHGAFLYGFLQGWEAGDILRFANAVSALKCTCLGGRTGIPRLEEVRRFLDACGEITPPTAPRKEHTP